MSGKRTWRTTVLNTLGILIVGYLVVLVVAALLIGWYHDGWLGGH